MYCSLIQGSLFLQHRPVHKLVCQSQSAFSRQGINFYWAPVTHPLDYKMSVRSKEALYRRLKRKLDRDVETTEFNEKVTRLALNEDVDYEHFVIEDSTPEDGLGKTENAITDGINLPHSPHSGNDKGRGHNFDQTFEVSADSQSSVIFVFDSDSENTVSYKSDRSEASSEEGNDTNVIDSNSTNLRGNFIEWALRNNVTHTAMDEVLKIFRENGHDSLPKLATTLLQTPHSTGKLICELGSGEFWYHGILNPLKSVFKVQMTSFVNGEACIVIDFFVDGLSPFKSPGKKVHIWPIAGRVISKPHKTEPFVIALWCGSRKEPDNLDEFFSQFVLESEELMQGFDLDGVTYKLIVRNCIADAPARAWVKRVNQHNSKVCCELCNLRAESVCNRIVYNSEGVGELRTDQSFKNRLDPKYHTGNSPLEKIMQMITQFPLDRMHLVDLGATKRILKMLLEPKASCRKLKPQTVSKLNDYIKTLSAFFPSEFKRKPKELSQWRTYKATELKRFLQYDGILVLWKLVIIDVTFRDVFECFLMLSCAIRILSDDDLINLNFVEADQLLKDFVKNSAESFGVHFVVFNIHHLTHLADDCKVHGILDSFSAELYESALGKLKNLIRAPGRVLPQLVSRILERQVNKHSSTENDSERKSSLSRPETSDGSSDLSEEYFQKFDSTGNVTVRVLSMNDNCCITKAGDVILVDKIVKSCGAVYFIGKRFQEKNPFFDFPVNSAVVGIYKVRTLSPEMAR